MDPKLSSDNFEYFIDGQNLNKEEEFSCYLCSTTYEKDLQLAAELGKTLLERNKELETSLKNHQNVIEDQSQEIEYLTKQTAALKEVNTSRIKIYEQLEISIQELEHSKETLSRQNAVDKKQIKSLQETIDGLENRCDELQSTVDRLVAELENEKRQRVLDSIENKTELVNHDDVAKKRNSIEFCDNFVNLSTQIQELKTTNTKDQKTIEDLRDQISVLLKENNYLQELLDDQLHKDEELKTLQEELATFDQIRVGNLCKRCLRSIIPTEDYSSADELSLVLAGEEEQEFAKSMVSALFNSTKSTATTEGNLEDNPYRMLVEKYEALLKIQEQQTHWVRPQPSSAKPSQCMSLRDELQHSGNFRFKEDMTDSEFEEERDDQESRHKSTKIDNQRVVTPSPNAADHAVHKGTQTDVHALPGSFLCKISDGNDCQFSIYDDASPVESRFRKTPEYRQLFKEIFAVLKRAAEAKDEGESLPLLDDRLPMYLPVLPDVYQQPRVPPVTPAREEQPFVVTETPLIPELPIPDVVKATEEAIMKLSQACESTSTAETVTDDAADKPSPQRDVMEHLMRGVRTKRNLSRGDRRALAAARLVSPSPSPCNSRSSSKRRSGSKARKKRGEHLTDSPNRSRERHQQKSNRTVEDIEVFAKMSEKSEVHDGKKARPVSMFAFGNGSTSASMEVAKLKYLEKSYAEVLRMGRKKMAGGKAAFM